MLGPVLPGFVHVAFVGFPHVAWWEIVGAGFVNAGHTQFRLHRYAGLIQARCPTPELSSRSRLMACRVFVFSFS
jgi:hypothetical protein